MTRELACDNGYLRKLANFVSLLLYKPFFCNNGSDSSRKDQADDRDAGIETNHFSSLYN